MAINPETQYPGKIAASSAAYPYGAARNITSPGDGTGTPWEAALVNDLFGFQQALLSEAGLVPNGNPDQVGNSQYLLALRALLGRSSAVIFNSLANLQSGTDQNGKTVDLSKIPTARVLGFATPNDGGAAEWRRNGTTGTPNAVDPANGVIYDAVGAGWSFVFTAGPATREVNPMAFGALADGLTNSTAIFNGCLTFADTLVVPETAAGFAVLGVIVPEGKTIRGLGRRSALTPFNAGNGNVVELRSYAKVDTLRIFSAGGKDSGLTSQNGVHINAYSRTIVTNYWADGLGGAAYHVENITANYEGNTLSNYAIQACNIGVRAATRGEYQQMGGGNVTLCNVGLSIRGGNYNAVGMVISGNVVGVDVLQGTNDAHGQLVGALLNHNTSRTIRVNAPDNGFLFLGLQMFTGGAIELINCQDVWFRSCVLSDVAIIENGCTKCGFRGNDFLDGIDNTPNFGGNPSEVFYLDNELPTAYDPLAPKSMNGGYLELEVTANTDLAAGMADFEWPTIVFNSITANLNYTVQEFYSGGGDPFLHGSDARVRGGFSLEVDVQMTFGKIGAAAWTADQLRVYLVDEAGGFVGRLTPETQNSVTASNVITYALNGSVSRNNFKFVIENNTGGIIRLYRQQFGTEIQTRCKVTGW